MTSTRAADGTANLHIWREGKEYLRQKGPVFLKQWNNLVFAARPGPPLAEHALCRSEHGPAGVCRRDLRCSVRLSRLRTPHPVQGKRCAQQIFNVLKPGGIFRISVPDLETACGHYLDTLREAGDHSTRQNLVRYRWAVMAIFEQMVRTRSGGLMLEAIKEGDTTTRSCARCLATRFDRHWRGARSRADPATPFQHPHLHFWRMYQGARIILGKSRLGGPDRLDPR